MGKDKINCDELHSGIIKQFTDHVDNNKNEIIENITKIIENVNLKRELESQKELNIINTTLAVIATDIDKMKKEIAQLFVFYNKVMAEDKSQSNALAGISGASVKANQLSTLWIAGIGMICAVAGVIMTLVLKG